MRDVRTLARAAGASTAAGAGTTAAIGAAAMTALLALAIVPTMLVAVGSCFWAWSVGWPWTRIRNLFLGSLILPVVVMVQEMDPAAPFTLFWRGVQEATRGLWLRGVLDGIGITVPLGYGAATVYWAVLEHRYANGEGRSLMAAERYLMRRRRRRFSSAKRLTKYPSMLTDTKGDLILGPRADETGGVSRGLLAETVTRHPRWLTVPYQATRQHMTIVADTGAGKTTTLVRIAAATVEASWRRYAAGKCGRPLLIMVDCKGGPDGFDDGAEVTDLLAALGLDSRRVGVWPYEVRLDMWRMRPRELQETLHELAKTDNHYYSELQRALLHLVVDAPEGPPTSSTDFLGRLDPVWLKKAWQGHPVETQMVEALKGGREPALASNLLLYSNLWRDLGFDFDSGRPLSDLDALYCVVHGTRRPAEAQARAAALLQIVQDAISGERNNGQGREVTLIFDEYSAVSDVPLYNAAERFRSLGCGVIACGQSWQSLGPDDDARHRLVNAASGGRLQMRSPDPEEMAAKAGTTRRIEASRHITSEGDMAEGAARVQDGFVVEPQRVREMQPGEIVFHTGGRAVWGRVVPVPKIGPPSKAIARAAVERPAITQGERLSIPEIAAAASPEQWAEILGRFGGEVR